MSDSVERSDALDERIAGSNEVVALARYGHTNRRLIRWLAVAIAFDVSLSVALGFVAIRAQQTANQANSIQQRAYAGCLSGNEIRKTQLQLWHYILSLPPTTPRSDVQQHQVDQFLAYVERQFAPRQCGPPPT